MHSLLAGVEKAQVELEPFPHIVVHDALDREIADRLLAEMPSAEVVTEGSDPGSNQYFAYSAARSLRDESLSAAWRAFVELHASHTFANEVFDLFDEHLPDPVRERVRSRSASDFGIRGFDSYANGRILLDAQITLNTPVTGGPSSVKGPHVDRPRTFYGATYYLRHEDDTSEGGALQFLRMRGSNLGKFDGPWVADDDVEVAKTIPYEHNVFVCWPNTIDALHRVSPRSVTPRFRYYANLLAEIDKPWYDWTPYQRDPQGQSAKKPKSGLGRRLLSRVGR